ncbi:NIPSNAP family protein [Seohaeicola nanhaiensis]|uniref:NIPSNAP family protein n=1 Tax=Seohaeicola nanhaiensis TaxID=1387282 RepID=A0ABV9KMN9_9RHOB
MYYEFRFYAVAPGRLSDEMALVRNVAVDPAPDLPAGEEGSLWDRYEVPRPVGSWITLTGRDCPGFLYIVPWESLDQRDACLPRFWTDPHWAKRRAELTGGHTLVNSIQTLIFSPLPQAVALRDKPSPLPLGGVHELRIYDLLTGDQPEAQRVLAEVDLPAAQSLGARILGFFGMVLGSDRPRLAALLAWPDLDTQLRAAEALDSHPAVTAQRENEYARTGRYVFDRLDQYLLEPMEWNSPRPNLGARA